VAAETVVAPVHPGEILLEEFLGPLGVSQYRLAKAVSAARRQPAGVRADAAVPGQVVVDVHGKQNGAINQEVTLGRRNIAPVSLLAEDRADVLEFCINGKHGNHSSHLHPRRTARDARPGQGLWSSL